MSRWRKILVVALFLLVTAAIGYLVYSVFFRQLIRPTPPGALPPTVGLPAANVAPTGLPPAGVAPPTPTGAPGAAAAVAAGGLTLSKTLVPGVARHLQLAKDGRSVYYYDQTTGQFFSVDPTSGVSTTLSDKLFPAVTNAFWSPTGAAQAILEFPDNRKIFFDFASQEQVTLPSHWQNFDWSPQGTEIVTKSIGVAENNRFLVVAEPDGGNARPVANLGRNADKVTLSYSPAGDVVALSRTGDPQEFGKQEIIPIGKNRENFRSFVVEGLGFNSQWSPDGSRILYSASSATTNWKPTLWVVNGRGDAIGSERKLIGLLTWADKCGFASPTVAYCAVPRDLPAGADFGRETANNTPDDFYRVDLAAGTYRLAAEPAEAAAVSKVIVSADGAALYYTELLSGALKQIRLR